MQLAALSTGTFPGHLKSFRKDGALEPLYILRDTKILNSLNCLVQRYCELFPSCRFRRGIPVYRRYREPCGPDVLQRAHRICKRVLLSNCLGQATLTPRLISFSRVLTTHQQASVSLSQAWGAGGRRLLRGWTRRRPIPSNCLCRVGSGQLLLLPTSTTTESMPLRGFLSSPSPKMALKSCSRTGNCYIRACCSQPPRKSLPMRWTTSTIKSTPLSSPRPSKVPRYQRLRRMSPKALRERYRHMLPCVCALRRSLRSPDGATTL